MNNSTLKQLLLEYSRKRNKEIAEANIKKEKIYQENPRLQEIDDELSKFSIQTAKSILQTNDKSLLDTLKSKKEYLLNEKNEIYNSLNIDSTYFYPQFECNLCKDTGYITENYTTKMCNCLKQKIFDAEYNKINSFDFSKYNFEDFSLDCYSDEINKEKYNSSISPKENIKIIKKICDKFIDNFDNPKEKNILFIGNTGLGKTFMSNCIANELLKNGKTVLYQTAPILLENVINYKMSKQKNSSNNIYQSVLDADLLIIDDLGTESLNSMKLSELFTILNTRILNLNKITKTIISTNLNINDIFNHYEERIGSRIAGYYDIYYFFGDDLRFKKR